MTLHVCGLHRAPYRFIPVPYQRLFRRRHSPNVSSINESTAVRWALPVLPRVVHARRPLRHARAADTVMALAKLCKRRHQHRRRNVDSVPVVGCENAAGLRCVDAPGRDRPIPRVRLALDRPRPPCSAAGP